LVVRGWQVGLERQGQRESRWLTQRETEPPVKQKSRCPQLTVSVPPQSCVCCETEQQGCEKKNRSFTLFDVFDRVRFSTVSVSPMVTTPSAAVTSVRAVSKWMVVTSMCFIVVFEAIVARLASCDGCGLVQVSEKRVWMLRTL
jgi:hypothetical protein